MAKDEEQVEVVRKKDRLKAALKANMTRRKAQKRARTEGGHGDLDAKEKER